MRKEKLVDVIDDVKTLFKESCDLFDFKQNPVCCRKIFKSSSKTICMFVCRNCNHSFPSQPSRIEELKDCPYCSPSNAKMLCPKAKGCKLCFDKSFASHPKSAFWDYGEGKNSGKTPYDVFKSGSHKADIICGDCSNPFQASCNNISTGFWCPHCVYKTEKKLYTWLKTKFPSVEKEYKPSWAKHTCGSQSRFDFRIPEIDLIIELDGAQHFTQVRDWLCPKEQTERDVLKMKQANQNGLCVIRLLQEEVLKYNEDWLDSEVLPELVKRENNLFIATDIGLYDAHIKSMD